MTSATRSRSARAARVPAPAARRYGCETPRIWTRPLRPLTPQTSLGFEVIDFAENVLGITLLPWQRWLLIHALELLDDGTFRFRTVVVLVARQNGKSTLLQILALWRMYVDMAKLVIGTAQNLDIAEEVWQGAVDIAQDVPELADEIERVVQVNGKKALELTFGSRYKVQAANRRGGRGLSGDLVALDELREHQSWDAWGAVTKTTLARPRAQVWALSNAGDSASIVLRYLRRLAHLSLGDPDGLWSADEIAALEGRKPLGEVLGDDLTDDVEDTLADLDDESLGIFEWSAPPECSLDDRDGWAQANPSLGYTITERAIASARRTDPEAVFRTEVLCQWVDDLAPSVISEVLWRERRAPELQERVPRDPLGLMSSTVFPGVDVAPGHSSAAIALAGMREDGLEQVEIADHRPGMKWVVARLEELVAAHDLEKRVGLMSSGPAGALVPDLLKAGFEIEYLRGASEAGACGGFIAALKEERLVHLDESPLNAAVGGASVRESGDSTRWIRRDSSADICPLVAASAARHLMAGRAPEEDDGLQVY